VQIERSHTLSHSDLPPLVEIWNQVYPDFMAYESVQGTINYLNGLSSKEHFFIRQEGKVVAWLCTFDRDGTRWFVMIVAPDFQGKGAGKALLSEVKKTESFLNGWVVDHASYRLVDGTPYRSPVQFYLGLGFTITEDRFDNGVLRAIRMTWERPRPQRPLSN
jgi:GNAT superfamily N-acetyltransferase